MMASHIVNRRTVPNSLSVLLVLLACTLSACTSNKPTKQYGGGNNSNNTNSSSGNSSPYISFDDMKDSAPDEIRDWSKIPDAVPKWEPRARYGNHSPYTVWKKKYYVLPNSKGYRETGIASWYGKKFSARPTSSQEPYDPYAMTAAHKRLPLPTYVRVTNLENNRSIVVRVNDRGPFHDDRIIDLSFAAAHKLDYANKGTARVLVEAIDVRDAGSEPPPSQAVLQAPRAAIPAPITPVSTAPVQPTATPAASQQLYLQVGAFSDMNTAVRLQQQLISLTQVPVGIHSQAENGRSDVHRVRVGPIGSEPDAQRIQQQIRNSRLGEPLLIRR
ncbi:MAG TPA: septal ring lytic transglycosylase RlpA family protein [Dongiaceae bacterium]|nr:septal ring lytic transglycosylase RlpA family protein [Dongiaceae bacterium]